MENVTEINASTDPALRAQFEVEQGGGTQIFLVGKDRVVFGGVESADIRVSGNGVAPIHALVEIQWSDREAGCSARLIDLASPGGTRLNDLPIIHEVLRPGDVIRIGDARIRFTYRRHETPKARDDSAFQLIDPASVIPIFDHPAGARSALEVVCSWNGVILNVKHFLVEEEVTLGAEGTADFQVPGGGRDPVPIAVRQGQTWVLNLTPGMRGILYLSGKLVSVEEYVREIRQEGGISAVEIHENDFVKVQLGALFFYLSRTAPPPVLVRNADVVADPFLLRMLVLSLGITLGILWGVSRMEVVPFEPEALPPVVTTILYHPEKYSTHRPRPKREDEEPLPPSESPKAPQTEAPLEKKKGGQKSAKGGRGERAKGPAGSRGEKNASRSKVSQTSAKRPTPVPGPDRGGVTSPRQDTGNLQMMKGATNQILDLLGASGQKLGASGRKLEGFGGFPTQGAGGSGLQGGGKGGGGTADTLLGGTAKAGRGGGSIGTGLGAEGTGSGIVGGKARMDLNPGGGNETVVMGSIDQDALEAALQAHRDEFRYCYEHELNIGHPDLAGKILTVFTIGSSGRASQMSVVSSSIGSPAVERCVLAVIGRIQFPRPGGGVPVSVKKGFSYSNRNK
jgi:hypothetical protein